MQQQYIKINKLKNNDGQIVGLPKNPRFIRNEKYKKLLKSIEDDPEFMNAREILTIEYNNDYIVFAGNMRLRACKELGWQEIPCKIFPQDTPIEKLRSYTIKDNINFGEFDYDLLGADFNMEELNEWGLDDLDMGLMESQKEIIEDEAPDLDKVEHRCKLGDIWQLGRHRVMCGDSTKQEDITKLLQDDKVCLIVTDPPYGVNYDPEWRDGYDLGVGNRSKGKVQNDDIIDWSITFSIINAPVIYVWHAAKYCYDVAKGLLDCDYEIISQIIWVKQHFVLSRGDYHWQHEPCWYAVKKGNKHNWQGKRDQATIWEIKNNNSFGNAEKEETCGHGTQKPVECMLRPILNNSSDNDIICDPFLGSGTTLIAAEQVNRTCLGLEIDPIYVDVILARWEKFTGNKAEIINSNT